MCYAVVIEVVDLFIRNSLMSSIDGRRGELCAYETLDKAIIIIYV